MNDYTLSAVIKTVFDDSGLKAFENGVSGAGEGLENLGKTAKGFLDIFSTGSSAKSGAFSGNMVELSGVKKTVSSTTNNTRNLAASAKQQASGFAQAWKDAYAQVANAGMNWKNSMLGAMSSFESSFSAGFWKALTTARGVFDAIKNLANNLFKAVLQAFEELIAKIVAKLALYGLLNLFTGGAFGTKAGGLLKFLGFAEGGLVPGSSGAAVPAIVHGGEYVLPASVVSAIRSGSSVGSSASLAGAGGGNISVSLSAPITINGGLSSDTDVRAVCEKITSAIKQGVSWGVENAKAAYKVGARHDGEAM